MEEIKYFNIFNNKLIDNRQLRWSCEGRGGKEAGGGRITGSCALKKTITITATKKRDAEMTSGNPSEKSHTHIKETVKNFRKITIATTKLTAGEGSRGGRGKK